MSQLSTVPAHATRWDDRLAFDMALCLEGCGDDLKGVLTRYDMTSTDMRLLGADPVFKKRVRDYRADIQDKGLTFKLKARAQAEELLKTSWVLIHNPDVSPAVKADLIKSTVKWAGLETRTDAGEGPAGGVRITINLGGADEQPRTINAD